MKAARAYRVLVTRAEHQASELAERLRELGMEPVLVPVIRIAEPTSFAVLDEALATFNETGVGSLQWIIFTSANAVEGARRRGLSKTPGVRIAAIGRATERALEAMGLRVDVVPPQAMAESLAEELLPYARRADGRPARFLLVRAEEARDVLPEALCAAGGEVVIAPAYRNVVPEESIEIVREIFSEAEKAPDAITFTSSSSARNLIALCGAAGVEMTANALRVSIGSITSGTLRELGHPAHAEAPIASVASLAETVAVALRNRR